jgi:HlyD family secretion protein
MKKRLMIAAAVAAAGFLIWRIAFQRPFLYAGTIEATEVDISPQVAGVISDVAVREGDPVKKDQVIVSIAGEDIRLAADIAEKDFRRAEKLRANGSMPEESFERLRYRRDDAVLKASWCTLKSPLDGVVLDRYHEPGELVNPSMKLLTLADMSEVWAYVYVPQPVASKLSIGQAVEAIVPEIKGRSFSGKIVHIRDQAEFTPKNVQTREERTRLVYGAKIAFPNSDRTLKPGMTVEVKLPE